MGGEDRTYTKDSPRTGRQSSYWDYECDLGERTIVEENRWMDEKDKNFNWIED